MHPGPVRTRVDVEAHKGVLEIKRLLVQDNAALIESRVISRSRQSWFALLLPAFFPVCQIRQIGAGFTDGVFDH